MYGKIFDSIYDGTLTEDWRALITFQQFIVLCDADGTLDMTPEAISRRTSIPLEHIKAGIEILENVDPYSRTPDDDGRRIVRLDDHRPWGWYIVNHNKYKHMQDADTVRAQNRERKRRQRAKALPVTDCHEESQNVTDGHAPSLHTDTNTNTNKNICPIPTESAVDDFMDFWAIYPRKEGKKKAQQSWNRLSKKNKALAIADIASGRYAETEKRYIPHAATYINAERWSDEKETIAQPLENWV